MTGAQWDDWSVNESIHWRERQDVLVPLISHGESSDRGYQGNGKWAVIRGEKRGKGKRMERRRMETKKVVKHKRTTVFLRDKE